MYCPPGVSHGLGLLPPEEENGEREEEEEEEWGDEGMVEGEG